MLARLVGDDQAAVVVVEVAVGLEAATHVAGARRARSVPNGAVVVGVVGDALAALDVGGRERPQVDELAADHAFATGRSSSTDASGCQQAAGVAAEAVLAAGELRQVVAAVLGHAVAARQQARLRAARVERAARGRRDRRGHVAA